MRWRGHVLAGALVFAGALVVALVLRAHSELHPPYPRAKVVAAVMRERPIAATLHANPWTDVRVIPLDATHWRATFFDGPRILLEAAVAPDGRVDAVQGHLPGSHPPGSSLLWTPALLVLLAALFVLAVAVQPLRSVRNLDALVIAGGFTLSALLNDARLTGAQVYTGVACLAYVAIRCAQVGFTRQAAPYARPVYARAFRSADASRLIRLIAAATLLLAVIVTVTSTGLSDVAFAALAGATKLNHGELPYGHLTREVVHGDTYPLLSYVLYMPAAAITPVRDSFDSLDGALWVNAVALVATAAVLYRLAGTEGVLAWVAFPPVLLAASTGGNDVPTALIVAVAIAVYARSTLAAAVLALAGWMKIVPAAALVTWLPGLRGRPLVSACAAVAAVLAAGVVALLVIGGGDAMSDTWRALRFQLQRGSWSSFWQQTGTRGLQPVFQAAAVGFAGAAAYEVWRRGPGRTSLRSASALAGALVALLQIGGNYWSYLYLPWLLPFILVALFPSAHLRSRPPVPPAP